LFVGRQIAWSMEFEKCMITEPLQYDNDSNFQDILPAREEKRKEIIFRLAKKREKRLSSVFATNNPLPLMASFLLGPILVAPSLGSKTTL